MSLKLIGTGVCHGVTEAVELTSTAVINTMSCVFQNDAAVVTGGAVC